MNPFAPPSTPLGEASALPPRAGWAKAVGVGHVVVATLSSLMMLATLLWLAIAAWAKPAPGTASLMMGMDHPRYLAFVLVDGLTGLIANGYTFAVGLALLNLRAWGARTWDWLAPAKIVRLVLIWGGFVIFVAPPLASSIGSAMVQMMQQAAPARARRLPTAAEMGLVYAWMFLAMGIGMIVLGSIYPAVTWWVARRPGLRAALVEPGTATPAGPAIGGEVRP